MVIIDMVEEKEDLFSSYLLCLKLSEEKMVVNPIYENLNIIFFDYSNHISFVTVERNCFYVMFNRPNSKFNLSNTNLLNLELGLLNIT